MNWLLSILVALLTSAAGLGCALFVADRCVSWYSITSREGAAGYFMAALGLLGIIAGFFIGLATARVVAAQPNPGFLKAQGFALAIVVGISCIALVVSWFGGDIPPTLAGDQMNLLFELKTPAGWKP